MQIPDESDQHSGVIISNAANESLDRPKQTYVSPLQSRFIAISHIISMLALACYMARLML
jgi:hypothetical protein